MEGKRIPRGIRQRNGRWFVDCTVNGVRKSKTVDTLEEAIAVKAQLTAEMTPPPMTASLQETGDQSSWTLQEAFDRTLEHVWRGTGGERTVIINAKDAVAFFGPETALHLIDLDAIDRWVSAMMRRGAADSTINRKLSALSKMLKVAQERGKLAHVPKMPRRREVEGRIRWLDATEEMALIGWFRKLEQEDHAEAAIVLVDTGMRCSELWRLQAKDVDFRKGLVVIWQTKNGQPRSVPMTRRVRDILASRAKGHPVGKLWPEGGNGWFRNQWERVRARMGLADDEQFVPHALRHTCCSRLVQRGVPLTHVKTWMGHTVIQTTMRYAHLAPHDLFTAAKVLEPGAEDWRGGAAR